MARARCRPRPPVRPRHHLGCDPSGATEYAPSGAHVYAFGAGGDPPRRVGRLRSPNRLAARGTRP